MIPVEEQMAAEIRKLKQRVNRLETLEDAGCLVLVEDKSPSGVLSVSFDSIPQTSKHLWLWIRAEADDGTGITMALTFNNDTGAEYDWERMENTTLFSGASDSKIALGGTSGIEWVAHEVNIFDYANANPANKRVIWKGARTRAAPPCVECTIIQGGANWNEVGAISSIQLTSSADNFGNDTRMTLYALC